MNHITNTSKPSQPAPHRLIRHKPIRRRGGRSRGTAKTSLGFVEGSAFDTAKAKAHGEEPGLEMSKRDRTRQNMTNMYMSRLEQILPNLLTQLFGNVKHVCGE